MVNNEIIFSPSATRNKIVSYIALTMVVYQMAYAIRPFLSGIQHQNIHLLFSLLLVFLGSYLKRPQRSAVYWVLISASLIATLYVQILYVDLEMRNFSPNSIDLVIGLVLIAMVVIATYDSFGPIMPALAGLMLIYGFFGHLMPPPFGHPFLAFTRLISWLSIGLSGIYGNILGTSANYVFLFIIFGALLEITGATRFFNELSSLVGARLRGGVAHTAIISSAGVGMLTGSAVANVTITGSFTIPAMIRTGYSREMAGAIEAMASTGGQLMPPIMGSAAFAMVAMTGIPYIKIITMAIIPSIIYYLVAMVYVELKARKDKMFCQVEATDVRELLFRAPLFILPLIVIMILLFQGRPVMVCAFWAIVASLALSLLRKETRPSWNSLLEGLYKGATQGAQIGVTTATLGITLTLITGTGLGIKLPAIVADASGGVLLVGALMIMGVSIVLGMGVPTIAAYLLVAIASVPALIQMGVDVGTAHFFAMYFAVFSSLTPPVALASLVASGMAEGDYWQTSVEAVKIAFIGFLLPFLFLYNPILLGQFGSIPFLTIVSSFISMTLVIVFGCGLITGFLFGPVNSVTRMIFLIASALGIAYLVTFNVVTFVALVIIGVIFLLYNACQRKLIGAVETR